MTATGYTTSYTATFQLEGVEHDEAERIARTVRARLDQAFYEIVAEAAEISAGNLGGSRVATSADGRKAITRTEASRYGLEEYDA